jgi:cytochrome b6-f complex iron-sulfur subunit
VEQATAQERAGVTAFPTPLPRPVLAAQAAGGAIIAIEQVGPRPVSRRQVLRVSFWAGLGASVAALTGAMFNLLWARGVAGFGGAVVAGPVDQFPPGSKSKIRDGRFWLVNLTEEQGGPGFLALWWKCPHLGCTVPWREDFVFTDPGTGQESTGWFRCPCHGSTYTHAGIRVFGPAPRSIDTMELTIDPSTKRISVNTAQITKGDNNVTRAVRL